MVGVAQSRSLAENRRRAPARGERPSAGPRLFELVVNLKTTRALELAMPDSLVHRADVVLR